MFLKKLEIYGFKSFAKKTILEFEPGITSVVGPNGSGKSNIADSLRWVIGEQSMKMLRGKKSEDVIFAGSEARARLGGAEVMIYFDNSDHRMPLDYEEVVIGRRLYRDGREAEYLINGSPMRLLDIQELLAKSGFGTTSYHVIGQGMIDQLILGGPAAIKELIEEASGVKPYYLKREKALRRLERTEANLAQVRALVAEIEPRLRSLRRQTRKLERRVEIESALREAQVLHFNQALRGIAVQLAEIRAKSQVFDNQIRELSLELKKLSADIDLQEKETVSGGSNYLKLQERLTALFAAKNKLLEEQAVARGRFKSLRERGAGAPKIDLGALRKNLEETYSELRAFFAEATGGQLDSKKWRARSEKLSQMFEALLAEFDQDQAVHDQQTKLASEEQVLANLEKEIAKLASQIAEAEQELKTEIKTEQERKAQLFVKERLERNKQETLVKTAEAKNFLAVEEAKLLTREEALREEARLALGANFTELLETSGSAPIPVGLIEKIASLKKQLEMIGGVDDLVVQEHRETEARYEYLTDESADLEKGIKDLRTAVTQLDEVIKKEFHEAHGRISEKFTEYFRLLFGGGRAGMTILRAARRPAEDQTESGEGDEPSSAAPLPVSAEEPRGPEITGIEIRAVPPGKKLGGIAALSGGERALTSIALLCAILATFPSPFVVLDEVDAALDEANSVRFGKILGTLAHKTQFITITHNRETMRQSHTLYGVTMGEDGVSKVLSLKLQEAAAYSSKN